MKILITGGLGFVGSSLARKLCKNHEIIIITKSFKKKNNIKDIQKDVKIEKVNILNFKKFGRIIEKHKPDTIIHLAGNTSHSLSFESPIKDVNSNSISTLFILEKIRELKIRCKFVLGSTFIVIGKPENLPVNEKTKCNPTTIYGANRLASEHYCKIYHDVYNLDTRIFRITNSFGPREQKIASKNAVNFLIYRAFQNKELDIYNNGKYFRDFIYIDDVISGISTILRKGKPGDVYWIASGRKTWFSKFAEILQKNTLCKINYPKTPSYTKKVDVGNFVVDNRKLKKLGWKPKFSTEMGIKKTLEFFRSD